MAVFTGEFTFKTLKYVLRGGLRKHGGLFVYIRRHKGLPTSLFLIAGLKNAESVLF